MKHSRMLAMAVALISMSLSGCGGGGNGGGGTPSSTVVAITDDSRLIAFDSRRPSNAIAEVSIIGLDEGDTIVGLDQRPQDGVLYALGSFGKLYTLDVDTGAAVSVGPADVMIGTPTTGSDIDFNPSVDRIRYGDNLGRNLRIDPATGEQVATDTDFSYADLSSVEVTGLAYSNSVAGALTTTLYAIDRVHDRLATFTIPNNGTLTSVGSLGLDIPDNEPAPFDISPEGDLALIAVGNVNRSKIATVDLATGHAQVLGQTFAGDRIVALAFFTEPGVPLVKRK